IAEVERVQGGNRLGRGLPPWLRRALIDSSPPHVERNCIGFGGEGANGRKGFESYGYRKARGARGNPPPGHLGLTRPKLGWNEGFGAGSAHDVSLREALLIG